MTPIRQLLSRIRWDKEFGRGVFELGYLDRFAEQIVVMPLKEVQLSEGERGCFVIADLEGRIHRIPFHRVREVYKDGQLIWQRLPQAAAVPQSKLRRARNQTRTRRLRPRPAG